MKIKKKSLVLSRAALHSVNSQLKWAPYRTGFSAKEKEVRGSLSSRLCPPATGARVHDFLAPPARGFLAAFLPLEARHRRAALEREFYGATMGPSSLHGCFTSPVYDTNSLRLSNGTAHAAENWFAVFFLFFGERREQDCQLKIASGRRTVGLELSCVNNPPTDRLCAR